MKLQQMFSEVMFLPLWKLVKGSIISIINNISPKDIEFIHFLNVNFSKRYQVTKSLSIIISEVLKRSIQPYE